MIFEWESDLPEASSAANVPQTMEQSIGEYELRGELGKQGDQFYYEAFQASINRSVTLVLLDPEHQTPENVELILSTVRLRATHPEPFLASVYDAQFEEGRVYYTRELLKGPTLAELMRDGRQLTESEMVRLVDSVVRCCSGFEREGLAMRRLRDWHIYLEPESGWRMFHPLVVGNTDANHVIGGIELLITAARYLLRERSELAIGLDQAAAKLAAGEIKDWSDFEDFWTAFRRHWGGRIAPPVVATRVSAWAWIGSGAAVVAILGVVLGALALRDRQRRMTPKLEAPLVAEVRLDGRTFWVEQTEVTIGAYLNFLESLEEDSREGRIPENWEKMIKSVQQRIPFQSVRLSYRSPVFGVDFDDAKAFAEWRGGRLPSEREWAAAALRPAIDSQTVANVAAGEPMISGWTPVGSDGDDISANGLLGFSGNVAEWTSTFETSSFNPGLEVPVICGGDFTRPGSGIDARLVSLRPEQSELFVGIRIVYDELPEQAELLSVPVEPLEP